MKNYFFAPNPNQSLMLALIYLVFGILLCFFGTSILLNAARILGILMLVYGIYLLYLYFGKRNSPNAMPLIQGLPLCVVGLVITISPAALVSIFPVVIGILVMISSVVQMQRAFILKDAHDKSWSLGLIMSVILFILGVLLLIRPIQILSYVLKLAGGLLILESIFMLIQSLQEKKYFRH